MSRDIVFLQLLRQKMMSPCKLDVSVKNRTAVASSVEFFKLEQKLFKGKNYLLASSTLKIKCGKSKGKKKYLSWVYGAGRKILFFSDVFEK